MIQEEYSRHQALYSHEGLNLTLASLNYYYDYLRTLMEAGTREQLDGLTACNIFRNSSQAKVSEQNKYDQSLLTSL